MVETMLNLSVFNHNNHLCVVNLNVKFIICGSLEQFNNHLVNLLEESLLQMEFAKSFMPASSFPNCEFFNP